MHDTDSFIYLLTTTHCPERAFLGTILALGSNLGVLFPRQTQHFLPHVIFHLSDSQVALYFFLSAASHLLVFTVAVQLATYTPTYSPAPDSFISLSHT
jgi:hypothetical protein